MDRLIVDDTVVMINEQMLMLLETSFHKVLSGVDRFFQMYVLSDDLKFWMMEHFKL